MDKKLYGLGVGLIVLCGLLVWLIYPPFTHAEDSVVFLHTTIPSAPVVEAHDVEDNADALTVVDAVQPIDLEQRLVTMLSKDLVPASTDPYPQSSECWRTVRMRVTGYCACAKCCGDSSDGITASNHRIRRGDVFVAADKRHPFGTEMVIPGYNDSQPVKVLDRGRAIRGNRLDLYFSSHHQAKKWGIKHLDVLVKTAD